MKSTVTSRNSERYWKPPAFSFDCTDSGAYAPSTRRSHGRFRIAVIACARIDVFASYVVTAPWSSVSTLYPAFALVLSFSAGDPTAEEPSSL